MNRHILATLASLIFLPAIVASAADTNAFTIVKVKQKARKREYTLITASNVHYKVVFCRADVFRILAAGDG